MKTLGKVELQIHSFLTLELDTGEIHTQTTLPQGKYPLVPSVQEAG